MDDEDDDPDAANDPINQIELQVSVYGLKGMNVDYTHTQGYQRKGKNREFGRPFFQTWKTHKICLQELKISYYTGNFPPTQGKFRVGKKELVI